MHGGHLRVPARITWSMDEDEIAAAGDATVEVIEAQTEHDVAVIEAQAAADAERIEAAEEGAAEAIADEAIDTANDSVALAGAALEAVEQLTAAVGTLTIEVAELRGRVEAQADAAPQTIEVEADDGATVDLQVLDLDDDDGPADEAPAVEPDEEPATVHPYFRPGFIGRTFRRRS